MNITMTTEAKMLGIVLLIVAAITAYHNSLPVAVSMILAVLGIIIFALAYHLRIYTINMIKEDRLKEEQKKKLSKRE